MPCHMEMPQPGYGVEEAIGNWGFSNNRVSSAGQELNRLKCLFAKMDCLRKEKPMKCVKYDCRYDPEAWHVKPSPEHCKPPWTFPANRPLIVYNSVAEIRVHSNMKDIGSDLAYSIPGRGYMIQGTSKWYRRGSDCCPQPSCLAPQCSRPCCD